MKKFVTGLAAVLIIALAAISVVNYNGKKTDSSVKSQDITENIEAAQTEPEAPKTLDYEAVRNAFADDEVVASVNGKEITWSVFRDWIAYYARTVEQNMQAYAMYGMNLGWNDAMGDNGETYASFAAKQAANFMQQIYAVMNYAEENGIIVEDLQEQLNARAAEDMALLGEDMTEEDFDKALTEQHMSRAHYDQIMTFNILYNEIFNRTCADSISDEEAVRYLEDNGYYAANHILFLTGDPQTEEAFDAQRVEEAQNKAAEIAEELKNIEDKDELVKRFLELKEEFDEDTGKTAYPNGYIFKLADMVPEFSDTVKEAAEYEVSDPVLSAYGFHVIIRMPLDPDAIVTGQQNSGRQLLAGDIFSKLLEEILLATNVELKPVLDNFTLADYLV